MTKTDKDQDRKAADHPAYDPARLSDFSEALKLNPLFAQSAAAMAAATAIGFGLASQMANAFFGALQSTMEAVNRQNPEQVAEAPVSGDTPVAAEPVAAAAAEPAPVAVKPKARPARKVAVPAAAKKAAAKPVAAEAPVKAKAAPKAPAKAPAKRKPAAKTMAVSGADDLKRISGIGPKLEVVLKGMGVTSVAQIAAWTDADIARFDKELGFEGRIRRDDWVSQAKALLK